MLGLAVVCVAAALCVRASNRNFHVLLLLSLVALELEQATCLDRARALQVRLRARSRAQPRLERNRAMSIEELVNRNVETLPPSATCVDAARVMRSRNVGSVIVANDKEPLGVLTDRDLAVRVVAESRDPAKVRLEQVMSPYLIFLSVRRSLDDAIATMRDLGVRRLPVVNENGHLAGIVSMDDILARIARQVGQLGEAVQREIQAPSS
jgi:CBS domain-containing protein